MKSARLGRPVSESWKASCSSFSADLRDSVTSVPMQTQPITAPSLARSVITFHSTSRGSPSRVRMERSTAVTAAPARCSPRRASRSPAGTNKSNQSLPSVSSRT